jgi:hypothetical protein
MTYLASSDALEGWKALVAHQEAMSRLGQIHLCLSSLDSARSLSVVRVAAVSRDRSWHKFSTIQIEGIVGITLHQGLC